MPGSSGDESVPAPFDEHVETVERRIRRSRHVLCCLDFDGTLAPIVSDPDAARILQPNRQALERLVNNPAVTVAIVSGRGLDDLGDRIEATVRLAGNHGLEIIRPIETVEGTELKRAIHPIAASASGAIATCCGILSAILDPIPNARVEHKRLTGTVHYRDVPEPARPIVISHVREIVERLGGRSLSVSTGKSIVEFGPAFDWGKGGAIELFQRECPRETMTVFAGDDTTDEDGFETVEPDGIGVLVGSPRASHASLRVDDPESLVDLLDVLDEATDRTADRLTGCDRPTSE